MAKYVFGALTCSKF